MLKCETAKRLQIDSEVDAFVDLLRRDLVRSYLEIGSRFGYSLWRIGGSLPAGARIVSIDLPTGDTLPALWECVHALKAKGYDAHAIVGDSTDPAIIEKARALGPFDACFIDANHTQPYVISDWLNYRAMTTKLVAFHDINFFRAGGLPPGRMPIEVAGVWNSIKGGYRHTEIKHDRQDNGIGVLWL